MSACAVDGSSDQHVSAYRCGYYYRLSTNILPRCNGRYWHTKKRTFLVAIGVIADIAAQLRVYEFAPCCRSVQHDVVKYHFLIAYLA